MFTLKILIIFWFFLIGLLIGGFFNVYLYRIPRGKSLFITSACIKCGEEIYLHHIIPVLGRTLLGGRCRVCREEIDIRYSYIEMVCSLIFGVACLICMFFAEDRASLEAGVGRSLWMGYAVLYVWSLVVFLKARMRIPRGIFLIGGLILASIFLSPCFFCVDFLVKNPATTIDDEVYGTVLMTTLYSIISIFTLSCSIWLTETAWNKKSDNPRENQIDLK